MQINSSTNEFWFYIKALRIWNTWLRADDRPEIEIEQFINQGFSYDDGFITGCDGIYDVKITMEQIHISFNGKLRYTWFPYTPQMGGLTHE